MKKQDFKVLKTKDLYPFPDNPFHVAEDETLSELAESIKEFGIVTPIITRPKEDGDGYEVIAGQRRVRASELAGINTVPAFVLPLDRDRAIITLVDSNLQRENILPSERAFAYKMKSEAMKRQGFRTDLTSSQVVTKLRTDDKVAQGFGVGRMTVQRFIRLTELIPPILQMVDEGKIALTPAVELSFLKKDEQENLFATMESEEATPSLSQAQRMKQLSYRDLCTMTGSSYKDYPILALGGANVSVGLENFLASHPEISEIRLGLNRDDDGKHKEKAGERATEHLKQTYGDRYQISVHVPAENDWNDVLKKLRGIQPPELQQQRNIPMPQR